MSLPLVESGFPLFDFPAFWQIPRLMQSNDKFIVAAAVATVFSHVVWVVPSWIMASGQLQEFGFTDYLVFNISVGITREIPQKRVQKLCYCLTATTAGNDPKGFWAEEHCFNEDLNDQHLLLGLASKLIKKEKCQLMPHVFRMDIISEDKMLEETLPGGQLQNLGKTSFILDIDEDYFGCESSVVPLYAVGLEEEFIRRLSLSISAVFCGLTTRHELAADFVFQKTIKFILANRDVCNSRSTDLAARSRCFEQIEGTLDSFSFEMEHVQIPISMQDISCIHDISKPSDQERQYYQESIYKVFELLLTMTEEQLKAVAEIGVCFSRNPAINFKSKRLQMRICDGNLRPHDTIVQFYTPDEDDVRAQGKKLEKILQQISGTPKLVTLCRSMRDGYTPRSRFHQIENLVLDGLPKVYRGPVALHVLYDTALLGGAYGWPGRWAKH